MVIEMIDSTYSNLENAIGRSEKIQSVIAQNIANINTPGYEPLEFDAVLNKAVKRANSKIVMEEELDALSRNSIDHSAYVKLLASKISVMRSVVTQGRK
jgi:flagellar basal body rod protein FlgB